MGMISEFKEFIARGNVIDLAVAVVIGAAFGKIVTALVDGIVMPVIARRDRRRQRRPTGSTCVTPAQLDAAGKEIAAELAITLRRVPAVADRLPADRVRDLPGAQGLQPHAQAGRRSRRRRRPKTCCCCARSAIRSKAR